MDISWHDSLQSAYRTLRDHEIQNTLKFTIHYRESSFHHQDITNLGHRRIHWENSNIPYDGIPYVIMGTEVLDCHHGTDRHVKDKEKNNIKKEKDDGDHRYSSKDKRRSAVQNTKKLDCPAKCTGKLTTYQKRKKIKEIKEAFQSEKKLDKRYQIVLSLPDVKSHQNHLAGDLAGFSQPVGKLVNIKIKQLVEEDGLRRVSDVQKHVSIYVKKELELDVPDTNRRFLPSDRAVRSIIYRTLNKSRYSKDDQQNLQSLVNEWRDLYSKDKFFIRLSSEKIQETEETDDVHQDSSFLFVHQTEWQQRLLQMYGQDICLLDATYKTTRFDIPLFFVCVNTNVGFSIVASFLVANENKESIFEAISLLKKWNPEWKPSFFMCDYDTREIYAIEHAFAAASPNVRRTPR